MDKLNIQENRINLKKMSIIELKEVLDREKMLLNNRALLNKLPDKGESVKKKYDEIQKELRYREDLESLEKSLNTMKLTESKENSNEKHVQKLCLFEKQPEKDRYKPFLTLNHKNVKDETTTQSIPLEQSISLLKRQDERTKEREMKVRQERFLQLENESTDETDSENESVNSDLLSNSDTEEAK